MTTILYYIYVIWTCICIAPRSLSRCKDNFSPLKFHLVRKYQRAAVDDAMVLESTTSLDECVHLALEIRGMALNYAPIEVQSKFMAITQLQKDARRQLKGWQQPAIFFNCHVLQCPHNFRFSHMINDSRFNYYSLYRPPSLQNYSCIPKVGLFILYNIPKNYQNASRVCSTSSEFSGSLAHIASLTRTMALAEWMFDFNQHSSAKNIFLAYIGLKHNNSLSLNTFDFQNAQKESLLCFFYRAWDVRNPYKLGVNESSSCVALTPQGFWQALSCEQQLPFICEIHTIDGRASTSELDKNRIP